MVLGENLGCFGASKKKKEGQTGNQNRESVTVNRSTTRTEPVTGMELLWQPEVKMAQRRVAFRVLKLR